MKASRSELMAHIGMQISRFQEGSHHIDSAAAAVLALNRSELQCVSLLWFTGGCSLSSIRTMLRVTVTEQRDIVSRLELAGYARRIMREEGQLVELTEHAREWIQTIWGPLQQASAEVMKQYAARELKVLVNFMAQAIPLQEAHAQRIRALLAAPTKSNRLRGGISPASLRRVQLFIEANLDKAMPLAELAHRAGLSPFHFSRAFKSSTGVTPRTFVEQRRIHRAKALLNDPSRSLVQIAAEVGMGSQSRFTTTFRKATGFTPAAYRRNL